MLVSDRHGLDDALDRLRERYGADPRFRFSAATDGIGWVDHYNGLLRRGRGRYFAWMPHDDTFPDGYYAGLLDHLDARPDTLLAFGPMRTIDAGGRPLEWAQRLQGPPPWDRPDAWAPRDAYRMLSFHPWVPFRGAFRLDAVRQAGLDILPTPHSALADMWWVFGVGLLGAVRYVDVPPCTKRFYRESTHVATVPERFRYSVRGQLVQYRTLARYVRRYAPSPTAAGLGLARLAGLLATRAPLEVARAHALRWLGRTP